MVIGEEFSNSRLGSGLESRRFGKNPRPSAGERVESAGSGRGWGGAFFDSKFEGTQIPRIRLVLVACDDYTPLSVGQLEQLKQVWIHWPV